MLGSMLSTSTPCPGHVWGTMPSPPPWTATSSQVIRHAFKGHFIILDWIKLDWIELDWIGLDWIGLNWIELDRNESDWIGFDRIGLDWTGSNNRIEFDWIKLN